MSSDYIKIPPPGGSGPGAGVDSFNGRSGPVASQAGDYNATLISSAPYGTIVATDVQGAIQELEDSKLSAVTGSNNRFVSKDNSGAIVANESYQIDSSTNAARTFLDIDVTDSGGHELHRTQANFTPSEDSPTTNYTANRYSANIQGTNPSFGFNVNGNALNVLSTEAFAQMRGDVGSINMITQYASIGDGANAVQSNGLSYALAFGNINSQVTLTGGINGYGFQPQIAANVNVDSFCQGFYDAINSLSSMNGYTSFNSSPNLSGMKNNSGFSAFSANGQISNFEGNSGYSGLQIGPQLGTFDTGGFSGVNINPTIASVQYATGLQVNMDNVTATGNKKAAQFIGDVEIQGDLSFNGALAIGKLDAYYSEPLADNGGNVASTHGLISAPTVAANATVANADYIGVNTASLMQFGDNSTTTTGFLGVAALGLPAVVTMGSGSTVDRISGAVFAISMDGAATGGTIDTVDLCRAVAIPNGITTVNKLTGFKMDLPFGDPGTQTWGVYITPEVNNHMAGSLTLGATDTPANSDVALEITSLKATLNSRLTTIQKLALTPIAGMSVYDTTLNQLSYYNGTVWVNV